MHDIESSYCHYTFTGQKSSLFMDLSSQASIKAFGLDCGHRIKRLHSLICTCVPLTAGFPWDAVSCGVHRGGEKVETRGQGLAGVFPGHWTHRPKKISSQFTETRRNIEVTGFNNKGLFQKWSPSERAVWKHLSKDLTPHAASVKVQMVFLQPS